MIYKYFFPLLVFFLTTKSEEKTNRIKSLPIEKVVIWGHKLYSNSFSYIHWGYYKAFKELGFKTHWFDNNDDISNFNFKNTLFFTEGQVEQKIPLRNDCFYILHNCNHTKYQELYLIGRCINLQVYSNQLVKSYMKKEDEYIFYDFEGKTIYMPWATDLLPAEIDEIKKNVKVNNLDSKKIYWIGHMHSGIFSNETEIEQFKIASIENGIEWIRTHATVTENIRLIQESFLAPALQGKWQCEVGYIPCRIFKNISYGQFGITNSETVYNLFNKKIVYNKDTHQLFYDAYEKLQNLDIQELYDLMDFVKGKHTYINRTNHLLNFISLSYNPDKSNRN